MKKIFIYMVFIIIFIGCNKMNNNSKYKLVRECWSEEEYEEYIRADSLNLYLCLEIYNRYNEYKYLFDNEDSLKYRYKYFVDRYSKIFSIIRDKEYIVSRLKYRYRFVTDGGWNSVIYKRVIDEYKDKADSVISNEIGVYVISEVINDNLVYIEKDDRIYNDKDLENIDEIDFKVLMNEGSIVNKMMKDVICRYKVDYRYITIK